MKWNFEEPEETYDKVIAAMLGAVIAGLLFAAVPLIAAVLTSF